MARYPTLSPYLKNYMKQIAILLRVGFAVSHAFVQCRGDDGNEPIARLYIWSPHDAARHPFMPKKRRERMTSLRALAQQLQQEESPDEWKEAG
jgi:hypothetical protein